MCNSAPVYPGTCLYYKLVKSCFFSRSLVFPFTATYARLSTIFVCGFGAVAPFGCGPGHSVKSIEPVFMLVC